MEGLKTCSNQLLSFPIPVTLRLRESRKLHFMGKKCEFFHFTGVVCEGQFLDLTQINSLLSSIIMISTGTVLKSLVINTA